MQNQIGTGFTAGGSVAAGSKSLEGVFVKNKYTFEAFDRDGNLKWRDEIENLITNVGLDDLLDKYLKGSSYTAAFFVGLIDGTPTLAAGDTMASHAGWAEVTAYDESARQGLVLGTVSGQSVNNSASKASFAINADGTVIGGAFLVTNSTKGGTSGVVYSEAAFTAGNKTLDDGDTLNVTVTCTAASA